MIVLRQEAVRLLVHARHRVGGGRLGEAVDLALLLVDPVGLEVDAVLALGREVLLVGVGHVLGRDRAELVDVEVELLRRGGGRGRGGGFVCLVAASGRDQRQNTHDDRA